MNCPKCNYVLDSFDKTCPRCGEAVGAAAAGTASAPAATGAPVKQAAPQKAAGSVPAAAPEKDAQPEPAPGHVHMFGRDIETKKGLMAGAAFLLVSLVLALFLFMPRPSNFDKAQAYELGKAEITKQLKAGATPTFGALEAEGVKVEAYGNVAYIASWLEVSSKRSGWTAEVHRAEDGKYSVESAQLLDDKGEVISPQGEAAKEGGEGGDAAATPGATPAAGATPGPAATTAPAAAPQDGEAAPIEGGASTANTPSAPGGAAPAGAAAPPPPPPVALPAQPAPPAPPATP